MLNSADEFPNSSALTFMAVGKQMMSFLHAFDFLTVYNAHGHIMPVGYNLRLSPFEKAQVVTALGITGGL
jgi:hypothetical protein